MRMQSTTAAIMANVYQTDELFLLAVWLLMVISPEIFDSSKWEELSSAARGVFLYLVIRADKSGRSYPSISRTAGDMRHHRNTIIAAFRELIKNGLITREHSPGRKAVYTIQPVLKTEPVINEVPVLENSMTGTKQSTAPVRFRVPEQNINRIKNKVEFTNDSVEFRFASWYWKKLRGDSTLQREPDLHNWATEIDKMHRIDKRPFDLIYGIIEKYLQDPFWRNNIKSPSKLRMQINTGNMDKFTLDEVLSDEEFIKGVMS